MSKHTALPVTTATPKDRRISLKRRLNAGAAALEARGLRPQAVDILPDGTTRFHFAPPTETEADLDRELNDLMAKL
jgi:hypothetical protein